MEKDGGFYCNFSHTFIDLLLDMFSFPFTTAVDYCFETRQSFVCLLPVVL